jgi:hypothetical protein
MGLDLDQSELLKEALLREMPQIEGVTWQLDIIELVSHGFSRQVGVSINAHFKVAHSEDKGELVNSIGKKLHEITSNGQVLLELE